jgi:hypothetical protein
MWYQVSVSCRAQEADAMAQEMEVLGAVAVTFMAEGGEVASELTWHGLPGRGYPRASCPCSDIKERPFHR